MTYWGTGNPGPDWNDDHRAGDNLYTDSMVALDVDTGKLKWYFQYTPHDTHDWDATQVPILADLMFRGQRRKLLLHPNRNGFFYLLDRTTGEYLMAKPYVKQTWAKGIDDKGRPMVIPDMAPTTAGWTRRTTHSLRRTGVAERWQSSEQQSAAIHGSPASTPPAGRIAGSKRCTPTPPAGC